MAVAQVIIYDGDNSAFVWKHPDEDFNSMTQLIVHESQEAVFFMNGEALDMSTIGNSSFAYSITYSDNTVSEERWIGRPEIFYTATKKEDFSDIKEKGTAYINFKYGDLIFKTVALTLK